MRCPKCGANIKKYQDRCPKCLTKIKQIENASFNQVKTAKAEFQPEKVVYSTVFPKDLSWKNTLLLCIFLGWMGAHYYYVKRYFKAICLSVMMFTFLLFNLPMVYLLEYGSAWIFTDFAIWVSTSNAYIISSVIGALAVIMWLCDILLLCFKRFKVPVVLEE